MTELEKLIEEAKLKLEEIGKNKDLTKSQKNDRSGFIRKKIYNTALEKELSENELISTVFIIGSSSCVNKFLSEIFKRNNKTRELLSLGLEVRDIASLIRKNEKLEPRYCPICGKLMHVDKKGNFGKTCSYKCNGKWTTIINEQKVIDKIKSLNKEILSIEDVRNIIKTLPDQHLFHGVKKMLVDSCEELRNTVSNEINIEDISYCLRKDKDIYPRYCKICGKVVHAHHTHGFFDTCSVSCNAKYCTINKIKDSIYSSVEGFDVNNFEHCKIAIKNSKGIAGIVSYALEIFKKNKDIKNALDIGMTWKDVLCCILNDLPLELFKCKVCGKVLHMKRINLGVINTCPGKCTILYSDDKRKKTCLERYGAEAPLKSPIVLEKINKKLVDEFGVKNVSQLSFVSEKVSKTYNDKSYKELLNRKDITPLFPREEWLGKRSSYKNEEIVEKVYSWKCNICGCIFKSCLDTNNNVRCPCCYEKNNSEQSSILSFLKETFPSLRIIENDRKQLRPKELDFYIPSLKIGIEYNGDYWHGTKRGKSKYVHYNKYKKCIDKNIRLITIPQNLWLSEKRCLIENKIKDIISNKEKLNDLNFSFIEYNEGVNLLNSLSLETINKVSREDFFISNKSRDFILVVGRPFFNKRFQWEIKYSSSFKKEYLDLALKVFENKIKPKSIVLYYDPSFGKINENYFNSLGFEYSYHSKPMGIFRNSDISKDFFDYEINSIPEDYFNKEKKFSDKTRNLFYTFNRVFNTGYQVFKRIYA